MKRFLLVAVMGAGLSATAQQQPLIKKLPYSFKPAIGIDTTGERYRNLSGLIQQRGLLPQATFSRNTSRGKVYTLPIDNMPCLVPDMNQVSPMPEQQYDLPDNRMPNAMPKQQIIPRKKKE